MKQDLERAIEESLVEFTLDTIRAMLNTYGDEEFVAICKNRMDLRTVVKLFATYGCGEIANKILEEVL